MLVSEILCLIFLFVVGLFIRYENDTNYTFPLLIFDVFRNERSNLQNGSPLTVHLIIENATENYTYIDAKSS